MNGDVLAKQQAWLALGENGTAVEIAAGEALAACARALSVLGENLKAAGYTWVTIEPLTPDIVHRNVKAIESATGLTVPKVLTCFWELVGGVSFIDLGNYRHPAYWKVRNIHGPNGFADGLYIEPCSDEWTVYTCEDYQDWASDPEQNSGEYLFTLAPDGFHKDNISGGAPYGVFPGSTWKPAWQYFEWSGAIRPITALVDPPDFLAYLRTAVLECAGFPGLFGVPAFEPVRASLLEGVPLF